MCNFWKKNKVCKLIKSFYGFKQAPKRWHERFDQVLIKDEFSSVEVDKYVYTKVVDNDYVIICLYVDEMLIFGTCLNIVEHTKLFLSTNFDMKDLGEVNIILGIKVIRSNDGIMLAQEHYVERILKKFECWEVTPVATPYDVNSKLKKNNGDPVVQYKYA